MLQADILSVTGDTSILEFVVTVENALGQEIPPDFDGSDIYFVASWPGDSIMKTVDDGVTIDPATGSINVVIQPEESARMPKFGGVRYALQRVIGENKETLIVGTMAVVDWVGEIGNTVDVKLRGIQGPRGVPGPAQSKTDLGIDKIDNTADKDKPISTAAQEAFDLQAQAIGTKADATVVAPVKTIQDTEAASWNKNWGAVASPFLFKTYYSGNLNIDNTGLWKRVLERHDGFGRITLKPGLYNTGGLFWPNGGKRLDIAAANPGEVQIQAEMLLQNMIAYFTNVDLLAPGGSGGRPAIRLDGGYLSLYDSSVIATGEVDTLFTTMGAHLHVTASKRDVLLDGGAYLLTQLGDIDCTTFKFLGNTTASKIKVNVANAAAGLVCDVAKGYLSGVYFQGGSKDVGGSSGLHLRRCSTVELIDDVRADNWYAGFRAQYGGQINFNDGQVNNCAKGLLRDRASSIEFDPAKVTFSGNTVDTETSSGFWAGGAKAQAIPFTTAGQPVAAGTTVFVGTFGANANENTVRIPMPVAGTIIGFSTGTLGGPAGSETYTYRLRKGSSAMADAGMQLQLTGSNYRGSVSGQIPVAAGDFVDIAIDTSAAAAARPHNVSIAFVPAT